MDGSSKLCRKPQLLDYLDIHLFLSDHYRYRKATERHFSYQAWAHEMGIKSRSFLRLVVSGKRSLTEPTFELILQNLNLDEVELAHARALYQYSTAQSKDLKEFYGRELTRSWKKNIEQVVVEDLSTFLQDPILPILFTYFSSAGVSSDPTQIAKALKVTEARIVEGIRVLTKMELLTAELTKENEISYRTKEDFFRVKDDPNNQFLKIFHLEGLEQAKKAHDLPFDERKYRSLLIPLNSEQMALAQKLIGEFAQGVLAQLNSTSTVKSAKIYRLNLQLFPVSEEIS